MTANRRKFKGRLGEYELLALLTKGELASLHLTRRLELSGPERFVVINELLPERAQNEPDQQSFLREARIGTLFRHPNLVGTQELGKLKNTYFYITEYLLGDGLGFLAARARATGRAIEPALAAEIVAQIAEGLQVAHELKGSKQEALGLIHQNINPDNLVVLASGRVKPVNFSMVRSVDPPHASRDPAYLSPEQAMGHNVDPRSDLFSLGVVLWEVLAGRNLFRRNAEAATRQAVIACLIPPMGAGAAALPRELAEIVQRTLARKPESRFASAGEMAAQLRKVPGVRPAEAGIAVMREFIEAVAGDRLRAKLEALTQIEASGEAPVDAALLLPGMAAAALETAAPKPSDLPPRPAVPEEVEPDLETVRNLEIPPEFLTEDPPAPEAPAPAKAAEPPRLAKPVPADKEDIAWREPVTQRAFDKPPAVTPPAPKLPDKPPPPTPAVTMAEDPFEEKAKDIGPGSAPPPVPPREQAKEPTQEQEEVLELETIEPAEEPAQDATPEEAASGAADGLPIEPSLRMRPSYQQYIRPGAIAIGGGVLLLIILIAAWPSGDDEDTDVDDEAAPTEAVDSTRPPEEVLAELEREQREAAARRNTKPDLANLQVLTDPRGCRVALDGKALSGRTPLENVFVPAGLAYEVTVACPGFETEQRRVTPSANQPAVLEFYPPPKGSAGREFGRLQLDTRPRTWVYLGKKRLGQTPLLGVRLPAGEYELRLVNKPKRLNRRMKVVIEADQTTSLQENF